MPHVHPHAPHELTEGPDTPARPRLERGLEFAAVLLLSLATLATAWSGYQAALFAGEQSQRYAQASRLRIHGQNKATRAGQFRIDDVLIFNRWLEARDSGNTRLARVYQRRFRVPVRPRLPRLAGRAPIHRSRRPPQPALYAAVSPDRGDPCGRAGPRGGPPLRGGDRRQGQRGQIHPHHRVLRRRAVLLRGARCASSGGRCGSPCCASAQPCCSAVWCSC